jgi:hypothetical protein
MAQPNSSRGRLWIWIVVALVVGWGWASYNSREPAQTQQPLSNTGSTFGDLNDPYSPASLPSYSPVPLPSFSPVPLPSFSPLPVAPYSPPGGYYENPAPGDDGTTDCPPGGGPVYVGSNDPNGFDGDGDGWGCE